jgi:hypothetical protein
MRSERVRYSFYLLNSSNFFPIDNPATKSTFSHWIITANPVKSPVSVKLNNDGITVGWNAPRRKGAG